MESLKILLVEDDADALNAIAEVLELHGHQVTTFQSSSQALTYAQTAQVDLLISDIVLLEEDGFTLLNSVRKLRPHLKALAITGKANFHEECELLGFNGYLRKPFLSQTLMAKIAEMAALPDAPPRSE